MKIASANHLFFDNAWRKAAAQYIAFPPLQQLTLLEISADTSVDMFSFAAKYSAGAPVAALEPYKK